MMSEYANPAYGKNYDFPVRVDMPGTVYMVAGTPRSGTSLLAFLCKQTGALGFPLEYFTPINESLMRSRLTSGPGFDDYVQKLMSVRTSPNGVFGFKMHYDELNAFRSSGGLELAAFSEMKIVLLERRDKLAQAISLLIASQTNCWIGLEGFRMMQISTPHYDRLALQDILVGIEGWNTAWNDFIKMAGFPVLRLSYEDLIEDCSGAFNRISELFGVDFPPPNPATLEIRKQGSAMNLEWKRRYLDEE